MLFGKDKSEADIGDIVIYEDFEDKRVGIITTSNPQEVFVGFNGNSAWVSRDLLLEVLPATKVSIDLAIS